MSHGARTTATGSGKDRVNIGIDVAGMCPKEGKRPTPPHRQGIGKGSGIRVKW